MPNRLTCLVLLGVLTPWVACAATPDEADFEVQRWDVVILQNGTVIECTIVETDDKEKIRYRKPGSSSALEIPLSETKTIKRRTSPDTILEKLSTKYKDNQPMLAVSLREALKRYRGIEAKALKLLEEYASKGNKDMLALLSERYLVEGKSDAAEGTARKIITGGKSAEGYLLLGKALAAQQKPAEALAAYEEARKLDPRNEKVLVALSELQLSSNHSGDPSASIEQALKENPNSVGALTAKGYLLLGKGQATEADACLTRARELEPKNVKVLQGLAACKALGKDFEGCYQLANEILQLDTRSAQAYGLQAFARLMGDDPALLPKALAKVDEALKENEKDLRAKALKAVILSRMAQVADAGGKTDEGNARHKEAVLITTALAEIKNSGDGWFEYLMGHMQYELKQYDAAAERFAEAAKLSEKYAPAHQAKGSLALQNRKWKEAEDAYQRAIALDGTKGEYYAGLGLAYLGMTRLQEGQKQFTRALELDPKNVAALCGLGYVANYEKDEARARKHFQQALAMDGGCAYAANALKQMYQQRDLHLEYADFEAGAPDKWVPKGGRQVKAQVSGGKVVWYGEQGSAASGDIEYHTKLDAAGDFVRLEADLDIAKDSPATLALRVASGVGSVTTFFIEFGKDASGHIAYRFRDYSGLPPDWRLMPGNDLWPDSGKARLAIETKDFKTGTFELYVNGVKKGDLPLKLQKVQKITVGLSSQAPEKVKMDAKADNMVLVKRKADEPEGGPGGGLIPSDPNKEAPKPK